MERENLIWKMKRIRFKDRIGGQDMSPCSSLPRCYHTTKDKNQNNKQADMFHALTLKSTPSSSTEKKKPTKSMTLLLTA